MPDVDEDVLIAAVDLVGRSGASELEYGFLHDDVPSRQAGWWAKAQYKGARITEENHPGPVEAIHALALRVLHGAKCVHCQGLVALDPAGAFAYGKAYLVDGTEWTAEQAAQTRQCLWQRDGARWVRGCEGKPARNADRPTRKQRRAHKRRKR